MPTITILEKPGTRGKARIEIDLNRWERLADVFGFYRPEFLKTLKESLRESKTGRIRKVKTLRELER